MKTLSPQEYADLHGLHCPVCMNQYTVEGSSIEVNKGGAYQNCSCTNCDAEWTDVYQLVGYDNLSSETFET